MTNEELQRRTVLRGLMAAGVTLCLPFTAGCDSKPPEVGPKPGETPPTGGSEPYTTAPAGSAGQPGTSDQSGSAPGKQAKAAVKYQDGPMGAQKCAACAHFIAGSGTCMLVEGPISPEGWCTLWTKKNA